MAPSPQAVSIAAQYPVMQPEDAMLTERLEKHVMPEPNTGCWLWMGTIAENGYGKTAMKHPGGGWTTTYAHREVYKAERGPIPAGLDLDHKCRVRSCVNPDHLEPVTRAENIRRMSVAGVSNRKKLLARTRCMRGHEYTPETTRWFKSPWKGAPVRQCRVCQRVAFKRFRDKRKLNGRQ